MSSTVRRVDPRSMAEPIKELFRSNGNPGAALWFDRSFSRPAEPWSASWISTDPEDRVVAHVAALPMRIVHEGRELTGAIFCNLMADEAHRTFFPILSVVKHAVKDLQADGVEFVMTNPSNGGAVAVMKAAGVKQVATHSRFLYLLGHRRSVVDLALGLHLRTRALLAPQMRIAHVDAAVAAAWTVRSLALTASVTARRAPRQYEMRYEAFGGPSYLGFVISDPRGDELGAAIVRREPGSVSAGLVTLRCAAAAHLIGAAATLGASLREIGVHRLDALAVVGSTLARSLGRVGFIARNEPWSIVGLGFTDAARAALAAMGDSDLERVDLD